MSSLFKFEYGSYTSSFHHRSKCVCHFHINKYVITGGGRLLVTSHRMSKNKHTEIHNKHDCNLQVQQPLFTEIHIQVSFCPDAPNF
ncbi:hypothetical protein Hanom_Chr10g00934071 [Helianthus anomalus]